MVIPRYSRGAWVAFPPGRPFLAHRIALDNGLSLEQCTLPAQRNIVRIFRRNYKPRNSKINNLMLEICHVPCRSRKHGEVDPPIMSPTRSRSANQGSAPL